MDAIFAAGNENESVNNATKDDLALCCPVACRVLLKEGFTLHDAEDAVQDALIYGLEVLNDGRIIRNPLGWLIRAGRCSALKARKRRSKLAAIPDDIPENGHQEMKRQEEIVYLVGMLTKVIDDLTPKQRDLFIYCKIDGHTIAETAHRFDLPIGTANGQIRSVRAIIQRAMVAAM
jgi:DNA-directed RNA polymerase specialized sigma24 family protein